MQRLVRNRPAEAPKATNQAEALKNQLFLIGSLVFFVGIASTEAYFNSFGVRYSLLGFPAAHITYRGLATIIGAWYLLGLYAVAVVWLLVIDMVVKRMGTLFTLSTSYVLLMALVALGYPFARRAGFDMAAADMKSATSSLPTLTCVRWKSTKECDSTYSDMRVLIASDKQLLIFRALGKDSQGRVPTIFTFPMGETSELRTAVPPQ